MTSQLQSSHSKILHTMPYPTVFYELPLGAIEPMGWLRNQLQIQADGLTGQLDDVWPDVSSASGWLGGSGESWERGPYYIDGLLPLAYLLREPKLIEKAQAWVEWTLSSQQADGQFGPTENDDWWCRMIMLKVLVQYQEATGDERVIPFLTKYFEFQLKTLPYRPLAGWAQARGGDNMLCVQWLYERTGEAWLLDLFDTLHSQTLDWTGIFNDFPFWRYQTEFDHRIHVVNVAMALKQPALYYTRSGEHMHHAAAGNGIRSLMVYHGQANGMFSGDEWLAGTHPSQGVELCAVVEYMYSLETLIRVYGDGQFADLLEKVAYNALPATISPDWHGHQYDQQVNQVMCNRAKRNWTQNGDDSNLFGLEPNFGCCTANMHQGWPKLAARLWMSTRDGGFAAVSYAPCRVHGTTQAGSTVDIVVDSDYPFREDVTIHLSLSSPSSFPIQLRIPAWCESPMIRVNGDIQALRVESGYATLTRSWADGDTIALHLPMTVTVSPRANGAVSVERGPIVYALPIGERWERLRGRDPFPDWELYPRSVWNFGIVADRLSEFQTHLDTVQKQPFNASSPPVRIEAKLRRVPSWGMTLNSAAAPPISPAAADGPLETMTLVPYGCARLRIAEFPTVLDCADHR